MKKHLHKPIFKVDEGGDYYYWKCPECGIVGGKPFGSEEEKREVYRQIGI